MSYFHSCSSFFIHLFYLPFVPGLRENRQKRESGYFSMGRVAGTHLLCDNSPPSPFRHFERGHPIFSNRTLEPKDSIPFRNPNLGVASERQIMKPLNDTLSVDLPPSDPYDIAVEVEAQVGPRSPSPTPFKIAESLAATKQKGFSSSYGRGSPSFQVSSYQQSGRFDSSRHGSTLQSRSSSPSHGTIPFRRSVSALSLGRHSFDGGGWTHRMELGSRNSLQGTCGQRFESGTLPRNFKSFANSVKSQSSTVSDFRSALRKTEVRSSLSGRDSRSSSLSRRDYNSSGQMSLQKTEIISGSSAGCRRDSRTLSSSRRTSTSLRDSHSSSSPRRNCSPSSQSLLRRSDSIRSLSGHGHHGRCGSPIREGYDIESQALLHNPKARNGLNDQEQENQTVSPSRRGYDLSQSVLRKTESSLVSGRRGCSSSGRRCDETPIQYNLKNTNTSGSLRGRCPENCNSSPLRRKCEAPSQPRLHKSEANSSCRSHESHNSMPSRKSYDHGDQHSMQKTETSYSLNITNQSSRNSSPPGKGNNDPPGYSILRNATNGESSHSFQRNSTYQDSRSNSNRLPFPNHSHCSASLSCDASPSRQATSGRRTTLVTLEPPRSPGSVKSGIGRCGLEDHCQSPNDMRPSYRVKSTSPSHQVQMQRHTSSQSSMESSESGQPSSGSSGRNRDVYAVMADNPMVKMIHQKGGTGHTGRPQKQQPSRRQELFKPARSDSRDTTKNEPRSIS